MRWQLTLAVAAAVALSSSLSSCGVRRQAKAKVPKVPQTTGMVVKAERPPPNFRAAGLPPMMQQQVLNAVHAGDGDGEILLLRKRMEADENDLDVRLELAAAYGRRNIPELELEHYRLAADKWPASGDAATALAKSYLRAGYKEMAVKRVHKWLGAMDAATDGEDRSGKRLNHLAWAGILLDEAGELQEGEQTFRKALQMDGKQDYLHNNLGQNLMRQGRVEEATASFRTALELNPASKLARNNLAVSLIQQPGGSQPNSANRQEALSLFLQDADEATAHNNLALSLLEAGQTKAAREEMELAFRYRNQSAVLLGNLQAVSEADGNPIVLPDSEPGVLKRAGSRMRGWFGGSKPSGESNVKKVKTQKPIAVPAASR